MSTVKGKPEDAKIIETRHVKETSDCKWIGLQKIIYKDPNGKEREWDSAVRTTRSSGGVDGIGILTILKYKDGKPDEILLQSSFALPLRAYALRCQPV